MINKKKYCLFRSGCTGVNYHNLIPKQKNDYDHDIFCFSAEVNYYLTFILLLNHGIYKNYTTVRAELLFHLSNFHHHGKSGPVLGLKLPGWRVALDISTLLFMYCFCKVLPKYSYKIRNYTKLTNSIYM